MFVIYNMTGIYITGIGCVAAVIAMALFPSEHIGLVFLALGLCWCVGDLFYRFKWGNRRLFHTLHGGHLYYVPMWIWGALCLYLGTTSLIAYLHPPKSPPPIVQRHPAATARTRPATNP